MDASKAECAIQLKELLQQDQDDFSLQNYLIERSYMFKNCNPDCSSIYSTKNLKWSMKYDLHEIRKRLLHATGVLRSTLHKFIFTVDDDEHSRDEAFSKRIGMCNEFSDIEAEDNKVYPYENHSSSIESMFHTFTLHNVRRPEVDISTKPYWISSKDNQQQYYNRGSEWKEPLSNTVRSPDAPVTPLQTFSRDPMFITYLRKLLVNSNILKFRRARSKKVKGIVEKASLCRRNREMYQNEGKSVPMEKVCEYEHFNLLEKHCREVRKITQMLHKEPCVISEEWKTFQIVSLKILADIGDSIMDDIVREIIDLF